MKQEVDFGWVVVNMRVCLAAWNGRKWRNAEGPTCLMVFLLCVS